MSLLRMAPLLLIAALAAHCAVHVPESSEPFELEGAHAVLACSDCHTGGYDSLPPRTCEGCHDGDQPLPHFDDECEECHTQQDWSVEYDHDEWELTGAHVGPGCWDCHDGDEWDDAPVICAGCHEDERPEGHNPGDCTPCHGTESWEPPLWTHGFFPLEGGHDGLRCDQCHVNGYHDTPEHCQDCHADDAPPGHPDWDCGECHDIYGWEDVDFTHDDFPLTGSHASLQCTDCHADGYEDTSGSCESCHGDDAPGGHPDWDCGQCHQATSWDDVTFDHNFFPLNGGHAQASCGDCHAGGYTVTPSECVDCHAGDNPHGFNMDCAWCHDVYGW